MQIPDPELEALRRRAARADSGSRDAADQLVETASEKNDLEELRRLAASGNFDAADVLAELEEEDDGSWRGRTNE